jgi:alpha-methylacyl-CoA racemase
MKARKIYRNHGGIVHPAPAPRFSRTPGEIQDGAGDGLAILSKWAE